MVIESPAQRKARYQRRQPQIDAAYDRVKNALSENPRLYGRTTIGDCPALAECMEELRRGKLSRWETVSLLVEQESPKDENLANLLDDLNTLVMGQMM